MNTASYSGTGFSPLAISSTLANPKEEDERIEETLTDLEHGEFTIKVPPPLVQKAKPPSQRNYVEILKDLFTTNHPSGNPTSSLTSHTDLTSPEVNDDIFDPEGDIIENLLNLDKTKDLPLYHDNTLSGNPTSILETVTKSSSSPTITSFKESDLIWEEFEAYLASDSFPPGNSNPSSLLPPFHNSLSGSTTSSSPSLLISETSDYSHEEFADELAHFTFPPEID
ncbi:hypothetical protein Tco_0295978 [Tanacetum coccineum]